MTGPVFPDRRPPPDERRFTSPAVEALIDEVSSNIADAELTWLFRNCLPNTLDTTVRFARDAAGRPDTYVITGDIDAMWLRDSTAQVWPYLPLAGRDPDLAAMLAGVVRRQTRCVLLDPYANAFYDEPRLGMWQGDLTEMRPGVHERKWELDSLAYFLRLSVGYYRATVDAEPFDADWRDAVRSVLSTLRMEQAGSGETPGSPYRFQRVDKAGETLANDGRGDPVRRCGLVRNGFRPSDDVCKLPFLVPSNAMAAKALRDLAGLPDALLDAATRAEAVAIAADIEHGLEAHAVVGHRAHGTIWAYEVDGFGGAYLMDDANVPSLLSLPYLSVCAKDDPRYERTRAFCLGPDNPYFAVGHHAEGIGSPHTGAGTVWPIALTMRALTAVDDAEIVACLRMLKGGHAGTGFMHEAFDPGDPGRFSRPWFAWANTLFGELVVTLHRERPHLLRATT